MLRRRRGLRKGLGRATVLEVVDSGLRERLSMDLLTSEVGESAVEKDEVAVADGVLPTLP